MKKILSFICNNKIMSILILIHYLLTFINDKFVFTYGKPAFDYLYPYSINYSEYIIIYLITKVLVLLFLSFFWYQIFHFFKKNNQKNKYLAEGFLFAFVICIGFLIFQWPGRFSGDVLHLLEYATHLQLIPWQSVYTSLFYAFSLSIIPFPTGIVIIQIILFSFIYAKIYNIISQNLRKKGLRLILLLPLFLPLVATNIVYPFRTTYYFIMEMYYFIYIFFTITRKVIPKKIDLIILIIVSAFLIEYRSEGIIHLLSFPIVFYFVTKFVSDKQKYFKYMILWIFTIIILGIPQNYFSNKYYNKEYLSAIFYQPLSDIFNNRKISEAEIDQLINTEELKKYSGHYFFEHNYTDTLHGTTSSLNSEKQTKFISCSIKIFIENIDLYIKSKINTFLQTLGYESILPGHYREKYIFESQYNQAVENFNIFPFATYDENIVNVSYSYIDVVFIIAMSIAYLLYCLIKRKYLLFILTGTLLAKNGIVFMTAPSAFVPYYLGIYGICSLLLMYLIVEKIDKYKIRGDI